jgi:hypothetical protein
MQGCSPTIQSCGAGGGRGNKDAVISDGSNSHM